MGKKQRPSNQPRRQRMKRPQRLASAKAWLLTYQGNKLLQAYRKRYGVDWLVAFKELEILSTEINPAYKQQVLNTIQRQAELKRLQQMQQALKEQASLGLEQDDTFAFIVGYTSGGAPYGITWEAWEDSAEDFE